jgi:hypothetical protein
VTSVLGHKNSFYIESAIAVSVFVVTVVMFIYKCCVYYNAIIAVFLVVVAVHIPCHEIV